MSDETPKPRRRVRTESATRPGSTPHGVTREHIEKRRRAIALRIEAQARGLGLAPRDPNAPPTKRPDMIGNAIWMTRREDAPLRFPAPEDMTKAAQEYFDWIEANPLTECKTGMYLGDPVDLDVDKMRAMSIRGLCLHMKISRKAWGKYQTRLGYEDAWAAIVDAIYTQKFEGAAAGLLSALVITRDLGLKERTDVTSGDEPVTEIVRKIVSAADAK